LLITHLRNQTGPVFPGERNRFAVLCRGRQPPAAWLLTV